MTLHEEIYFEINVEGEKEELEKFVSFILSGELDDFFEFSPEYIIYNDEFDSVGASDKTDITIANDEYGIEINRFDPEEFLEVFCKGTKKLYVNGCIYDIDDEEYRFVSAEGDTSYTNAKKITRFNDELDEQAYEEELNSKDDYES